MESKSPAETGQKIDPDLVSKLKSKQVVTEAISEGRLPFFLKAALVTGFKVEKIADEGGEFPYLSYEKISKPKVVNIKVRKKGYIGVSIEKPENSKEDHHSFWAELERSHIRGF